MRKILIIMFCSFIFIIEGNAIGRVTYYKDQTEICDSDNNHYPVYVMYYNSQIMYFLNLSGNYNTNFEDYYEISFEDSPYSKELSKYVTKGINGTEYYNRAIHILLWEELNPDKTFDSCRRILTDTSGINEMKALYLKVNNFELDKKEIYINEGEIYEYISDAIQYYKVVDADGLDVIIEDNVLKVHGLPGKYHITFQHKGSSSNVESRLYTDGVNYLISSSSIPTTVYETDIIIGSKDIIFEVVDGENVVSGACFFINDEEFCSDEEGKINFKSFDDNFTIKLINLLDIYDEYNDDSYTEGQIVLQKKIVEEEESENISPDINYDNEDNLVIESPSEIVEIPLENTYAFPLGAIIIIVGCIVKKRFF